MKRILAFLFALSWVSSCIAQELLAGASSGAAPATSIGREASWYLDVDTGKIYGPKSFGVWGASSANLSTAALSGPQTITDAWTFSSMVTGSVGFTATTGGVTASAGNIVATLGNINATAGSMSAGTTVTAGTGITATTGNITSTAGNLVATVGAVSAGTTVTAGTGVTSTTGNVVATAGNVLAGVALSTTAAVPAISSCGTSPPVATVGSSNNAGQFTLGTDTPTACTVTFATAYANYAYCTVTPASAGGAAISGGYYLSAQSKTAFTLTIGTGTDSLVFNYTCVGN
jgi:hypothetical protein